jgi:DNA replication protein DnaC
MIHQNAQIKAFTAGNILTFKLRMIMQNTIEGEEYQHAHLSKIHLPDNYLQVISEWCKTGKNMLLFLGNPGVGKTYFCAAYLNYLIEKKKWFRYMHEKDFFGKLREVINNNHNYEYEIAKICEAEHLIIDDIGSSQMTEFQKEALLSLVDHRSQSRKPTVITSNHFIKDLYEKFEPRFCSRLRDHRNTIIELNWIDKRVNKME